MRLSVRRPTRVVWFFLSQNRVIVSHLQRSTSTHEASSPSSILDLDVEHAGPIAMREMIFTCSGVSLLPPTVDPCGHNQEAASPMPAVETDRGTTGASPMLVGHAKKTSPQPPRTPPRTDRSLRASCCQIDIDPSPGAPTQVLEVNSRVREWLQDRARFSFEHIGNSCPHHACI